MCRGLGFSAWPRILCGAKLTTLRNRDATLAARAEGDGSSDVDPAEVRGVFRGGVPVHPEAVTPGRSFASEASVWAVAPGKAAAAAGEPLRRGERLTRLGDASIAACCEVCMRFSGEATGDVDPAVPPVIPVALAPRR